MSGVSAYRTFIEKASKFRGLRSQQSSHYSGNFGFNSLSIDVTQQGPASGERERESVEAHEALHAVQAFTQSSARELFRAMHQLNRYRFLYLAMLLERGVRIKVGETIFEAAARGLRSDFDPVDRQIEDACNAVLSCYEERGGISVLHLIEGAARAVECINLGEEISGRLDDSPEPYRSAWVTYRSRGGQDARVFAQLCTAALRYGSIDPIYSDTLPHPSEVFLFLLSFVNYFEAIARNIDVETPDFGAVIPPGNYDEFGPIRAGKPQEFLEDSPPIKTKDHFFPDEMFEATVESALEGYKSGDRAQIALEDRLFGVSSAIAEAMETGYVRVADPMATAKVSDRKLTLDLVQIEVQQRLPGLFIEEVSIKSLVDPRFQRRVADVFKRHIAPLHVKPWTGESKEVPVETLSHFYDVAEAVDKLSLGEAALRARDTEIFQEMMPRCCRLHRADTRTLLEICDCENEGGVNRNFGELFGVDLADFMRG